MTANEVFDRATALLGYSNSDGTRSGLEILESRATVCINQILADLSVDKEILGLEDTVSAHGKGLEAVIYGTAMLLALSISDNEKNVLFAGLYNVKRAAYRSAVTDRRDVLPSDDGGVSL